MRVELADGTAIELGTVQTTPTIGITDYSVRTTDAFGVTTVVERGFSRTLSAKLGVLFDDVDAVQQVLAGLRATPGRWVADDGCAWLSPQGYFKDFSLDLQLPPLSYCTLTVEGLAETETVADPGGDPAPAGQPSTLRLLQPVDVTDAVLVASSVAEDDASAWSFTTSYQTGARVIDAATHRIYESLVAGNASRDPATSSDVWLDVGPTNRWAAFDDALGTAVEAAGQIVMTLAAGAIDALALLDVVAATVRVQAGGYDRSQVVGSGAIVFDDLAGATGAVTVTIAGPGQVSVGTLIIGHMVALGVTESSPTAGITDYSVKAIDEFGAITVVQRAWAKAMTAKALIRTDAIDVVANRIASVRAQPALWLGQAGSDSLTVYGFFKDFSIDVDDGISKLSLSIEGLSTAAKVAPIGTLVAWPDITDPAGTKPDDNAVDTRQPAAPIGDRTVGVVISDLDAVKGSLDLNVSSIFDLAKTLAVLNAYAQARTTLDGKAIGTIVVQVREVTDSTVETLSLIGAKNAGGTAIVLDMETVQTDATTTLAQRFEQTETYSDTGLQALGSQLEQTITDGDHAASTRLDTVEADLNGANGLTAQVSFLQSAVVTASGDAVAKAVLSVKANGRIGGLIATNDGAEATLDLDFDSTRIFKPDGTLLFQAEGDGVYMPNVEVDTLKVNAAIVPAFTSATDRIQGTGVPS